MTSDTHTRYGVGVFLPRQVLAAVLVEPVQQECGELIRFRRHGFPNRPFNLSCRTFCNLFFSWLFASASRSGRTVGAASDPVTFTGT